MLLFVFIRVGSCCQKNKKCFGCSKAKMNHNKVFKTLRKTYILERILVAFYHRDNGDVVCLSEITLSMKDTSSCFLFVCIFHSGTLRESIQLRKLSFQLFQCTCDPLIRGFLIGFIQTATNKGVLTKHLVILKKKSSLGDGARAFVTGFAKGSEYGH